MSRHRPRGGLLAVAFVQLVLAACGTDAPVMSIGLPEGDTAQSRQARIEMLGLTSGLMLAPGCTKLHQALLYHDCQSVVSTDGDAYGATLLAAIDSDLKYVGDAVFNLLPPDWLIRVGSLTNKPGQPFQFAPHFELRPASIHCLYLGRPIGADSPRWRAMFVDCTADPTALSTRLAQWNPEWNSIHVERIPAPGGVPNTATLDWDDGPSRQRQIMGIRCGSAWCLVSGWGPPSLRPIPNATTAPNRAVRGWHDQQVLAVPAAAGKLRPGRAVATLMAEPGLESLSAASFTTSTLVARAHFTQTDTVYQRKFNFDASGNSENEIRIVNVGADWFADIHSASGSVARFAVVRREDAHGTDPPGSVRWGWLDDDENVWVRCGQACCEVTPGRLQVF